MRKTAFWPERSISDRAVALLHTASCRPYSFKSFASRSESPFARAVSIGLAVLTARDVLITLGHCGNNTWCRISAVWVTTECFYLAVRRTRTRPLRRRHADGPMNRPKKVATLLRVCTMRVYSRDMFLHVKNNKSAAGKVSRRYLRTSSVQSDYSSRIVPCIQTRLLIKLLERHQERCTECCHCCTHVVNINETSQKNAITSR